MDSLLSEVSSLVALFFSAIALYFTAQLYGLKRGTNIRGLYSLSIHMGGEDKYISSVILENVKDRSVAIFKIYLHLGHNYFIELEDFADSPLILKPFETYSNQYDPIDFYRVNLMKIRLNNLLASGNHKIVLSTSDGRCVIKEYIDKWDALSELHKNNLAAIIRPIRSTFRNRSYGSKVKFIVEFELGDGGEKIVPIYPWDHGTIKFGNIGLTSESLDSKESLEKFLKAHMENGSLTCASVKVHDIEAFRRAQFDDYDKIVIDGQNPSWFAYYIKGRTQTIKNKIARFWTTNVY